MAFRWLASFATLQTGQPGIRLVMRHVQSGEFVVLPCFKRSLTEGFTLFFAIQKFSDSLAQNPVRCAVTGLSQLLKPDARGFVQFDCNRSYGVHTRFLQQGIIR